MSAPTKAITLHRPWAWAIIHGPKRIENRGWAPWTSILNKPLAIHAGRTWDEADAEYIAGVLGLRALPPEAGAEGLIGTVVVTGCVQDAPPGQEDWFSGPMGWVLEQAKALPTPIPCRGAQGLWTIPAGVWP